ncbi:PIN domain-containing protein [bacterium]|nr:PIN domain-containing protein [bacterium]
MSLKYLLDTNIISVPTKANPNERVMACLQTHKVEIATATVVWHELLYGCRRLPPSKRRRAIEAYLDDVVLPSIPLLPYDVVAARWHAAERARLEKLGQMPPFVNGQIAAIAAVNGLTLVTNNVSDFTDFQDLTVVDWSAVYNFGE